MVKFILLANQQINEQTAREDRLL